MIQTQVATQISPEVRKWYDVIEALPTGSRILLDYAIAQDVEAEIGPFAVAVFHHMFRKSGLKLIFVSTTSNQSILLWEEAIRETNPDAYEKKYGEDYVMLGYFAGIETAMGGPPTSNLHSSLITPFLFVRAEIQTSFSCRPLFLPESCL